MPDVNCPHCGRSKRVTEEVFTSLVGKSVRCACKAEFVVEDHPDPLDFLKDVPPPVAHKLSLPTSPAQQQPNQFKANTERGKCRTLGFLFGSLLRRVLKTSTERVMWGTVGLFLGVMIGTTFTLLLMRDSGPRLWPSGDISGPGPRRPLTKEEFIDERVMTWVIDNKLDGKPVDEESNLFIQQNGFDQSHISSGSPLADHWMLAYMDEQAKPHPDSLVRDAMNWFREREDFQPRGPFEPLTLITPESVADDWHRALEEPTAV